MYLTSYLRTLAPVSMLAVVSAGFLAAAPAASAAVSGVSPISSAATLGANDYQDWSAIGADYTDPTNPFSEVSHLGLGLTISEASNTFEKRTQTTSWFGNFTTGDAVLWTNGTNGPITIQFASPVSGAGLQIDTNYYGAFTATIQAFNAAGTALNSAFTSSGTSANTGDGSAIFIGLKDTRAEISRIVIAAPTASGNPNDFAVNRLLIVDNVPEPGTWAMCAFGLVAGAWGLRRRANAAS